MSKLKPKRQNYKLTDLRSTGVGYIDIDGIKYTCNGSQMFDDSGEEVDSIIISNSDVSWKENKSGKVFSGELKINKK